MRRRFASELAPTLDTLLFASPSHRTRQRVADELAQLDRAQQDVVLHWAHVIAQTHPELAWQVCARARAAFERDGGLSIEQYSAWIGAILDEHDLRAAPAGQTAGDTAGTPTVLDNLEDFLARQGDTGRLAQADIARRLSVFVAGLSGGSLRVDTAGAQAWTDGETLFVPEVITARHPHQQYCALAALVCAQWQSGGLTTEVDAALAEAEAAQPDVGLWFAVLEEVRLGAVLARQWPGLAGAISALPWMEAADPAVIEALRSPSADALQSLAFACQLAATSATSPAGARLRIDFPAVRAVRSRRQAEAVTLRRLPNVFRAEGQAAPRPDQGGQSLDVAIASDADGGEAGVAAPGDVAPAQEKQVAAPPPEHAPGTLRPAGEGRWQATRGASDTADGADADTPADARYDEWDFRRNAYRKQWCHVFARPAPEGDAEWVRATRDKHARLIAQIRRRFESLRGEERWLRRQREGSEIDLDAVVEALTGYRAGADSEIDPRLFSERQRSERSLAVMFMVDMSGSTKGWVNDAEREALVMLCEALEAVGDRYAIYGFSGWTHRRCDVYPVKTFDQRSDLAVRQRIAGIEARDYTRMGPAIRHLTTLLAAQPERHKLLVTISDGRPDDFGDDYRGRYGIEDTRRALHEARRRGVRSYCITVDRHAADYLPQLYGSSHYSVLADATALPRRIAQVYRRLVA